MIIVVIFVVAAVVDSIVVSSRHHTVISCLVGALEPYDMMLDVSWFDVSSGTSRSFSSVCTQIMFKTLS